jgi:hypothetical protein
MTTDSSTSCDASQLVASEQQINSAMVLFFASQAGVVPAKGELAFRVGHPPDLMVLSRDNHGALLFWSGMISTSVQ